MIKVWDPLVRIFHWTLAVTFAVTWVTSEGWDALHEWAGYAAGGLIALRVIWGLIGPKYARFSQFVKSPKTTIAYMRSMAEHKEKRYMGHNPAGAAMIIALLITLGVTVWTGWMLTAPAATRVWWMKDAHGLITRVLMALVLAHIAGVFLASYHHKENLFRSMVHGKKRAAEDGDIV